MEIEQRLTGVTGATPGIRTAIVSRLVKCGDLVKNAGVYHPATAEVWRDTIGITLNMPLYLSRAAVLHPRETKDAIVNIASDRDRVGGKKAVDNCASKGGVDLMTNCMALDHAHGRIRANAVCAGDAQTPMLCAEGATREPVRARHGAKLHAGKWRNPA